MLLHFSWEDTGSFYPSWPNLAWLQFDTDTLLLCVSRSWHTAMFIHTSYYQCSYSTLSEDTKPFTFKPLTLLFLFITIMPIRTSATKETYFVISLAKLNPTGNIAFSELNRTLWSIRMGGYIVMTGGNLHQMMVSRDRRDGQQYCFHRHAPTHYK